MKQRDYDSTVARIAGNLLSGMDFCNWSSAPEPPSQYELDAFDRYHVSAAVAVARAIVAEVKRTEPQLPNEGGYVRTEPPNQ